MNEKLLANLPANADFVPHSSTPDGELVITRALPPPPPALSEAEWQALDASRRAEDAAARLQDAAALARVNLGGDAEGGEPVPCAGARLRRALALSLVAHLASAGLIWAGADTEAPEVLPMGETMSVDLHGALLAGDPGQAPEAAPAPEPEPEAEPEPAPPEEAIPLPSPEAPKEQPKPEEPEPEKPKPEKPKPKKREKPREQRPKPAQPPQHTAPGGTGDGSGANTAPDAPRTGERGGQGGTSPVPLGQGVNPRPRYPEMARQRGQQGTVMVVARVDAAGRATNVALQSSSGYPLLDEAALKAVRQWRFTPARQMGVAVRGIVVVPVHFRLR